MPKYVLCQKNIRKVPFLLLFPSSTERKVSVSVFHPHYIIYLPTYLLPTYLVY